MTKMELQRQERMGMEKFNKNGDLMKIIEYHNYKNIVVEFQDEWKRTVSARWDQFKRGCIKNPHDYDRSGKTNLNFQGCIMKCIEYYSSRHIIVEFQDDYKYNTVATWDEFTKGSIRNLYYPSILDVGIIGSKYKRTINGKHTKEYTTWYSMLKRCFDEKEKERCPTYKNVTCCKEWLLFENFYEWFHSQENFEIWKREPLSAIDKDILVKHNKLYSPETCCLVPHYVNSLFVKNNICRGKTPIGVMDRNGRFCAQVNQKDKLICFPAKDSPEEAFLVYKNNKENIIKQVAQEEYKKGTITKRCYEAMMSYKVEITD